MIIHAVYCMHVCKHVIHHTSISVGSRGARAFRHECISAGRFRNLLDFTWILDFRLDFGFQTGFLDFKVDFWISKRISGFEPLLGHSKSITYFSPSPVFRPHQLFSPTNCINNMAHAGLTLTTIEDRGGY